MQNTQLDSVDESAWPDFTAERRCPVCGGHGDIGGIECRGHYSADGPRGPRDSRPAVALPWPGCEQESTG